MENPWFTQGTYCIITLGRVKKLFPQVSNLSCDWGVIMGTNPFRNKEQVALKRPYVFFLIITHNVTYNKNDKFTYIKYFKIKYQPLCCTHWLQGPFLPAQRVCTAVSKALRNPGPDTNSASVT